MNVITTGATKGIGLATAHAFAALEANLAVCSRSATDLAEFRKEFSTAYPTIEILSLEVDLSKREAVEKFSKLIKDHWSRVDVLVNNAGQFIPGQVHLEEEGILESQIETNLYSAYHMSRAILPLMLPQAKGHIFNLCSVASFMAYPNGGSYSISKFALLGFTKVLRAELMNKGIKVTAIMPGATWSSSWEGAKFPEERLMQADDIAKAIVSAWQLSPSAVVEEIIIRPQLGDV